MTRREIELFAMLIRMHCKVHGVELTDHVGMVGVASGIELTFAVSHGEIITACSVNSAGKGFRSAHPG